MGQRSYRREPGAVPFNRHSSIITLIGGIDARRMADDAVLRFITIY